MALINRVARLFRADFNAVLDQIEEPEQLLRQAIRDMEDDITATEQSVAALDQEQKLLGRRAGELEASIADFDGQLDLCFDAGKDSLARGLIRQKLEAERLLKHLVSTLEANRASLADHKIRLDENRVTVDGLRQKAEVFAHRSPATNEGSQFDDSAWLGRAANVSEDEVEIAFLREQSRREAS